MRAGLALFTVLALMMLASGCAQIPQKEIDDANAAYNLALKSDAAVYASAALREAEAAKTELEEELAAQEGKSGFSRSYINTKDIAAKLQAASEYAVKECQKVKGRVKDEYNEILPEAEDAVAAAEDTLSKIRRNQRKKENYDQRMEYLEACKTRLAEAQALFDEGNYWDARSTLNSVKEVSGLITLNQLDQAPADFIPVEEPEEGAEGEAEAGA